MDSPFSTKSGEKLLMELVKNRVRWLLTNSSITAKRAVGPSTGPVISPGDGKSASDLPHLGGEAEKKQEKEPQEKPTPEDTSAAQILWCFDKVQEEPKQESKEGKKLQEQERVQEQEHEQEPKEKPTDQKP